MNKAEPQTTWVRVPDGATLLVVDHNPFVRRALRRTLELERISVVEAGDGEQALSVVEGDEARVLDVVLTSLLLPVISAPEFIAVLLECRPELPVVAMSALGELPAGLPPVPLLRSRSSMRSWCERSPRWFSARKRCAGRRVQMPPTRAHWPNDNGRSQETRWPVAGISCSR
jgi:CheY-like chemotaxis protein